MTIYNGQECMMISSFIVEGGGLGCHHNNLCLHVFIALAVLQKTHKEEMSLGSRLYSMDTLGL